jgi:ankyrin repeat protein
MHSAASNNSAAVIPLLLAAKVDPNAKNKSGYSFKSTNCNVLFF